MKKHILQILLTLILTVNQTLANNNYIFRNLTVYEGLADNEVKSITKDRNRFIWCVTNSAVNRFDGYSVKKYTETNNGLSLSGTINSIKTDLDGNIWINRFDHYFIYDREKDCFVDANALLNKLNLHNNSKALNITIDEQKNIWSYDNNTLKFHNFKENKTTTIDIIGKQIKHLYCRENYLFYINEKNIIHIKSVLDNKEIGLIKIKDAIDKDFHNEDFHIYVDNELNLWLYNCNGNGLWLYTKTDNNKWEFSELINNKYLKNNKITCITEDNRKRIWIGMEYNGICIYDKKKTGDNRYYHITNSNDNYSLSSNKVWCFYNDNENTIWIGTMRNGISFYNEDFFSFNKTKLPFPEDISCIAEDENNNLWFGTDGGGIYKKENNGTVKIYNIDNKKLFSNNIVCLFIDSKKRIWVGTYLNGFGYLKDNKFYQIPFSTDFPKNPIDNSIWSIAEDNEGYIWLGNLKKGLMVYNPKNHKITTYDKSNSNLPDNHIMSLFYYNNKLYMATCNGTCEMDTKTRIIRRINSNKKKTQFIKDTTQNNIFIDSRKLLWIGGRDGITVFDMALDSIYYINQDNRLKGTLVRSITEDNSNDMWVATTDGITKIRVSINEKENSYQFKCHPFSKDDGLQTSDFLHNSLLSTRNRNIIIGGNGGYYNIMPSIAKTKKNSKVIFTKLRIYNQDIKIDSIYSRNKILKKNIELQDQITLNYNQNTFALEFTTTEYIRTHDIRYSYRIKGKSKEWTILKGNLLAFNNMVPDNYIIEVRASESEGMWDTPSSINITITPPIWLSNIAKLLYAIMASCLFIYIIYINNKRQKRKIKYKEIELEAQKQHEIDQLKLNFFTNLSHDFRTPLTLILSPVEELIKENKYDTINNTLSIIHKNALELLNLVNQILDFRKLETINNSLNLSQGDFIGFLEETIKSFYAYAETNKINISLSKKIENLVMMFDKDKINKIIMNLLSNAIKFADTPGKIEINIWVENNNVYVSVSDNGKGIDDKNKDKIFEPFFQTETYKHNYGSGIGLNIVKQFLLIHGGEINVKDNIPHGSIFTFNIPIISALENEHHTCAVPAEDKISTESDSDNPKYTILIVEDYTDMREFLYNSLKDEYLIITAVDGLHALSIIQKENIDIIISDIMMPNMDGIELCKTIKKSSRTSKIPVILLTAKNDNESTKEGLTYGADDYIQKPFNIDILKLRINKILRWKNESYKSFTLSQENTINIPSENLDEEFIKKLLKIIEENIDNPQFSVEDLSSIIGISRSNLYNKITSIADSTPSEFIRKIRLHKSIELLKYKHLTIAEVAYKVGFNSPKIYTHYFKEEYNTTPTEYRKTL